MGKKFLKNVDHLNGWNVHFQATSHMAVSALMPFHLAI